MIRCTCWCSWSSPAMSVTDLKVHMARADMPQIAYCGAGKRHNPKAVISTRFVEVTCKRCRRIVSGKYPWRRDE